MAYKLRIIERITRRATDIATTSSTQWVKRVLGLLRFESLVMVHSFLLNEYS